MLLPKPFHARDNCCWAIAGSLFIVDQALDMRLNESSCNTALQISVLHEVPDLHTRGMPADGPGHWMAQASSEI
jgi:hypothetical protein